MLDFLAFGNTEGIEHIYQSLGTEQSHNIVFQRDVELGFTGVTLTSGTATQLIVNTSGLMTLSTDNHKTACCLCLFVQLDIRTTARHVGGDGNGSVNTGIGYDFRFQFMEFCI